MTIIININSLANYLEIGTYINILYRLVPKVNVQTKRGDRGDHYQSKNIWGWFRNYFNYSFFTETVIMATNTLYFKDMSFFFV